MGGSRKKRLGFGRTGPAVVGLLCCLLVAPGLTFQRKKTEVQQPAADAIASGEADRLEAVITTEMGVIRFEFFPQKAPKHVANFIKLARAGFYNGSAIHRVVRAAIIQGGDPLLRDAQTGRDLWGTGGLRQVPDEFSDASHLRGTVSAVRIVGEPNSGGAQFFICVSDQPQLDGQFSAFGQMTEGFDVLDRISQVPADERQLVASPVKIDSVVLEPKKVEPFKDATIDQLRRDVLLKTSFGEISVEMSPDIAPEHVRNFLKLVESGWYDRTAFHRVAPGFVIQGGMGFTRTGTASHRADRWVRRLKAEVSKTNHVRGSLSMARTEELDSATTSFFIVLRPAPHLDGRYTVFGKVVDGFAVLDAIEGVPRDGETPRVRIEIIEAAIKP
jgi:cyclophilin family peptidyl-prolyl cis-trans isomerase